MTTGAFFDMDLTLLSESSNLLWVRYMRERGELRWQDVVRYAGIMLRYQVGLLDVPEMTRRLVKDLAGQPEAERIAFSRRWVGDQVSRYIADGGRRRLDWHRGQGHRPALITASPGYTADALAEHLDIPAADVVATRFEIIEGRFTGNLVEPMCYGDGKLQAAQDYAGRHGIDLRASYFYTDSISDLPLLEYVGHPVAVNPDTKLRKLAEERNWSIVRFY